MNPQTGKLRGEPIFALFVFIVVSLIELIYGLILVYFS